MNRELVDKIARAVLYEGYLLYPYRPSVKNRQRWTFGGLYPRSWSESQEGADAWTMQTQCLITTKPGRDAERLGSFPLSNQPRGGPAAASLQRGPRPRSPGLNPCSRSKPAANNINPGRRRPSAT